MSSTLDLPGSRPFAGRAGALLRDIEVLAAFGPRLAGSPAERNAAAYIAGELRAAGLAPEIISFDGYVSQPAAGGRVETAGGPVLAGKGVAFAASTPSGGLEARLVRLDAPGRLDGAIALAAGLPHHAVLAAAARRGAAGVIAVSTDDRAHSWQISPLWGSPAEPGHLDRFAAIPALQVGRPDGERLDALAREGQPVRLFAETSADWRRLSMPTVHIAGREPGYLLVAGHFCSWGPGASDNAAGNALMLDLARHYARGPQPRFGLRLAWWTGHEQGGYAGSSHFSDLHHGDLARNAIGYLSVDNVGSRGAGLGEAQLRVDAARWHYFGAARLWELGDEEAAGYASLSAKVQSIHAGELALENATRIAGPSAFQADSALTRVSRDLRYFMMREQLDAGAISIGSRILTGAPVVAAVDRAPSVLPAGAAK